MLVTLALTVAPILTTRQDQPRIVAHLPEGLKIQRSSLRFAPGGKQLAYVAYRGEDELWVVGDTVGDVYESVEPPVFDATGAHVAFRVATLDKKGKESWTLLVDGKKVATQPWIGPVAFSPVDGTPAFWAFRAFRDYDGKGAHFEQLSMPTTAPRDASLFAARSPDGSKVTLVALNFSPTEALEATVNLKGCQAAQSQRVFRYAGNASGFSVVEVPVGKAYRLPPYSIVVVELGMAAAGKP